MTAHPGSYGTLTVTRSRGSEPVRSGSPVWAVNPTCCSCPSKKLINAFNDNARTGPVAILRKADFSGGIFQSLEKIMRKNRTAAIGRAFKSFGDPNELPMLGAQNAFNLLEMIEVVC
jgi:hypothetical protein